MSEADVTNFLDMEVGEVKDPMVLPNGTYLYVITKYAPMRANNDKKTPFTRVTLKPVEVRDVDNWDDDANLDDYKRVTHDFWQTDNANKIVARFLVQTLGLDNREGKAKFSELWEQAIGREVVGATEYKLGGRNKDRPFNEVTRFFSAE